MFDVENDIEKAKEKINSKEKNSILFHNQSPIYKCTHEMMKNPYYSALLSNNKDILTVIGSGDQILNAILFDSINIDAVDICTFSKYFLEFKKAAVKCLAYEEYLEFFFGNRPFNNQLYDMIINRIDNEEVKMFWDSLCSTKFFKKNKLSPPDLYNSSLFNSSNINIETAIKVNPYLDEDSFYVLKRKIHNNISINYITGDIKKINEISDKEYNFVNLSNICMYDAAVHGLSKECKYKKYVTNLKLADNGKVLSYLLRYIPNSFSTKFYEAFFKDDDNFTIHQVQLDNEFPDALLVYKKTR